MNGGAKRRIAVVLFNLGGPDRLESVQPFLFNLFNDPAIIGLPWPARPALASLISRTRQAEARRNYAHMGGASPLLAETRKQAAALQLRLGEALPACESRVFIAMRYWAPLTAETAREVADYAPEEVVLLPLYPQYSTTTTGSSVTAWRKAYRGGGDVHEVCCFPDQPDLVGAHAALIRRTVDAAKLEAPIRLLFSAHGLPEQVIHGGDPYQWQVEQTCAAVVARLGGSWDWQVCYQSRVGPLAWIGPSTPDAITAAGRQGKGVVVVPIAFVSEHVETLVELDRDYAGLARQVGCPDYLRVPALGTEAGFISALGDLVAVSLAKPGCAPGREPCPPEFSKCPYRKAQIA